MTVLRNIIFIFVAALSIAAINYAGNLHRPDLSLKEGEVSLADLKKIKEPLMIVDARPAAEYAKDHIKGAFNLSEAQFESLLGAFLDEWTPETSILVYCNVGQCNSSRIIADRLKKECGMQNVFVLKDDWKKWKD